LLTLTAVDDVDDTTLFSSGKLLRAPVLGRGFEAAVGWAMLNALSGVGRRRAPDRQPRFAADHTGEEGLASTLEEQHLCNVRMLAGMAASEDDVPLAALGALNLVAWLDAVRHRGNPTPERDRAGHQRAIWHRAT
jgi:hypothetical protein